MKTSQAWAEYCKSLATAVVEACSSVAVTSGPAALGKALTEALPDWRFRRLMSRGGWYRIGGLMDAQGHHLASNLETWAEQALDDCDGDFSELAEQYAQQTLYATRLVGQTHYFVAPAGDGTADFLQLEIEELQEMRAHRLFFGEIPNSLEELIDPRVPGSLLQPIGMPRYAFRKILHIGSFLDRMRAEKPEPSPIHRMVEDWAASSAGSTSAYANHWVLATREHLDRYHQTLFRAQPIAVFSGQLPEFDASPDAQGVELSVALNSFDKEIGYPMAWYFHLLIGKAVPHWVAQKVVEDALAGFAYLPDKDLQVVKNWLHRPYSV